MNHPLLTRFEATKMKNQIVNFSTQWQLLAITLVCPYELSTTPLGKCHLKFSFIN